MDLRSPSRTVFDESCYTFDAVAYLGGGVGNRVFGSRYLIGTGVLLGAAVATKSKGLFVLVPVVVLWGDRRALNAAMSLVVAPLAAYLASYVTFFVQQWLDDGQFLSLQGTMFRHHRRYATRRPRASRRSPGRCSPIPSAMPGTRSLPTPTSRRLDVGVGVAAMLAALAYAPVWRYLPIPVGWLRLLPLVPTL